MKKRPILITGIHRSGSTWLGKIMGASSELRYIHEPFNFPKNPDAPFSLWFKYISKNSAQEDQKTIRRYLNKKLTFNISRLIEKSRKAKYPGQVRDAIKYELKYFTSRPLLKDPIAFIASEWIHNTFDADIVVLIRHPAAFVASLKFANWKFDFRNLLNQKLLMENELSEYKNGIIEIIEKEERTGNQDIIAQGILLWNCIYSITKKRMDKYEHSENWLFIKHEDLSFHPMEEIKKIFIKFDLKFTAEVKSEIERTTRSKTTKTWERDSIKNISTWKDRLDRDEISLIKEKTSNLWVCFYTEDDWT